MAAATKEQIMQLEKAHAEYFGRVVIAGLFRVALYKKYGPDDILFKDWNKRYKIIATRFAARQRRLNEITKGNIAYPNGLADSLFTETGLNTMKEYLNNYVQNRVGTGIIPLLIWAVTAIIGFFTASTIVDELNNTSEEQQKLVESTNAFCKDNNLNPEQCKAILTEQTKAAEGGGGLFDQVGKLLLFAGLAFLGYKFFDSQNKKQAA